MPSSTACVPAFWAPARTMARSRSGSELGGEAGTGWPIAVCPPRTHRKRPRTRRSLVFMVDPVICAPRSPSAHPLRRPGFCLYSRFVLFTQEINWDCMPISQAGLGEPNSIAGSLKTPEIPLPTDSINRDQVFDTHRFLGTKGAIFRDHDAFLPDSRERPSRSGSAGPRLGLLRRQPAVDDEAGAGHEGGIVGGEKDDAFGDVVGYAEPADRVVRQGEPARRLDIVGAEIAGAADEGLVAHIGLDYPRMDRVDPHPIALAGEFEGRRFGEQRDTALGQRIERVVLRADEPGNRGEVDDGAAMRALPGALAQRRQSVLGAEEH